MAKKNKKSKKKIGMKRKYKVWLVIIVILLIVAITIGVLKIFIKSDNKKPKNVTNIISNIDEFGYTLDDRDTKYMKKTFEELEDILNAKEIDYEKYSEVLAKLFVIDFYTLDNKINKYDVGSLEYILSSKKDGFKMKAMDTIYGDVIDNTYKDRIQDLPEIKLVDIIDNQTEEITVLEEKKEAYKVTMKYEYVKDMGYDEKGTIYLVKNDKKLEVVSYEPVIE